MLDARGEATPQPPDRAFGVLGGVLGLLWLVTAARWTMRRTENVHRLDGRYPTRTRAAIVWAYPAVWVAIMAATLMRASPNDDFDFRPPVVITGFVIAMAGGYRVVHRVLRSLVRMPPTATCVAFYLVDVAGFGLVWWRLSSWWGDGADLRNESGLDQGILVAALVALAAGALVAVLVERAASRAERTRLLTLRTRYDHRVARLNGLDPMSPTTRYALMLARRAAERAAHRPVHERTPEVAGPHDELVRELAAQLEHGITADFAARVRELERRTDGMLVPRLAGRPLDAADEPQRDRGAAPARRLWLAELLRYVVLVAHVVCVTASLLLVLAVQGDDASGADLARTMLQASSAAMYVVVALWAIRIAFEARRVGVTSPWRVPAAAAASAVVVVALWFVVDPRSDAASLGVFMVLALGLELALWRISAIDRAVVVRDTDGPLLAWMSLAPLALGLFVVSPMRHTIDADASVARTAFFAVLVGLSAAVAGGLAGVSMVQIEDSLRAVSREPAPAPAPAPTRSGARAATAASATAAAPSPAPVAAAEPEPVRAAPRR